MEEKLKPFRLLIVAATPFEIAPLHDYLKKHFTEEEAWLFRKARLQVKLVVTGVGMTHTAYFLGRLLQPDSADLAVNVGIAGAYNKDFQIGQVLNVISERFGDLGVEEADGSFTDVHQMGLLPPDEAPFQFGALHNPEAGDLSFLPSVNGLTVNKVHGFTPSIEAIQKKYGADVETMEGAAFFLACLYAGVPFLEIRAISNYVESRNKDNWNLPLAIERLNEVLVEMLKGL